MCTPSNSTSALNQQQKLQEKNTNASVNSINSAFSGFTPQFFQGVNQSYQNYAIPQLAQQRQQTQDQLGFKLANQGLTGDNSVAQGLYNKLGQANTNATQQIGQQGLAQAQGLQQQVAQEKSNLIGQAQTATNPQSFSQQAIAQAGAFGAPSQFAPVGQLFGQFANQYLANQNANTFNPATAYLNNQYNNNNAGFSGFLPSTQQFGR